MRLGASLMTVALLVGLSLLPRLAMASSLEAGGQAGCCAETQNCGLCDGARRPDAGDAPGESQRSSTSACCQHVCTFSSEITFPPVLGTPCASDHRLPCEVLTAPLPPLYLPFIPPETLRA